MATTARTIPTDPAHTDQHNRVDNDYPPKTRARASYHEHFNTDTVLEKNVDTMVSGSSGYDVTIVCCGTDEHAAYWQKRLEDGMGVICHTSSLPLAVSEFAWDGGSGTGAGNGLGTLYAMQCAIAKAAEKGMPDMMEKLAAGQISVGLFHTAGKGTRFAPLPGSENNNKPGVRLPAMINLKSGAKPVTILEAVIKQTGAYAASRKGRVSVYWGDQLFVPTVPIKYTPSFHVDILAKLGVLSPPPPPHDPAVCMCPWMETGTPPPPFPFPKTPLATL